MDELAGEKLKLLKRLNRSKDYTTLSDHEIMLVAKYICREIVGYDSYNAPIYSNRCKINDVGIEQLALEVKFWKRWAFPLVISTAALVIAIIALLKP
jgi:hypothetical protein